MAVQHRTRHCRWLQRWAYRPSSSTRRDARPQVRLSLETIIAIGDNQSLRMAPNHRLQDQPKALQRYTIVLSCTAIAPCSWHRQAKTRTYAQERVHDQGIVATRKRDAVACNRIWHFWRSLSRTLDSTPSLHGHLLHIDLLTGDGIAVRPPLS